MPVIGQKDRRLGFKHHLGSDDVLVILCRVKTGMSLDWRGMQGNIDYRPLSARQQDFTKTQFCI